ncbi:tetratricopeptide repeat protein, partial [Sporomusa malonica]
DLAIADYNQAIQLNPQYSYAYYARGFALAKLGSNQEAISNFKLFLQYATPGDSFIETTKQLIRKLGGTI